MRREEPRPQGPGLIGSAGQPDQGRPYRRHDHAGEHWRQRATGVEPRLPMRPTQAEKADLHYELDRALRGCSWCMGDAVRRLGDRVDHLQARHQADLMADNDGQAAA